MGTPSANCKAPCLRRCSQGTLAELPKTCPPWSTPRRVLCPIQAGTRMGWRVPSMPNGIGTAEQCGFSIPHILHEGTERRVGPQWDPCPWPLGSGAQQERAGTPPAKSHLW